MLIVTAKLPRRKLALWALAAAALCCCALLVNVDALRAHRDVETTVAVSPKGIKTSEDRVAFLSEYGWQVKPEPLATQELIIPQELDESYTEYLTLQSEQGFDLEAYAGKTVKRYTYQIKNYPGLQENIWASILVYKHTVIGGEVFCNQGDGFTQGLPYPAAQ